ncbi:MAG TPA: response regulator [Magnetovibrio sp.]
MQINEFEKYCALVVEDVPSMRQLLVHLLREIGFKDIMTCEDGAEALNRVEHSPHAIDLIICDLEMPIISGLEFIQMLRGNARKEIKDTPVVVVTGHSEEKNLHQAVRLGVHGFLVKPVSRKSLETRVRHALKNPPINPEVFINRPNVHSGKVKIIDG